jgi:hypothetical protein
MSPDPRKLTEAELDARIAYNEHGIPQERAANDPQHWAHRQGRGPEIAERPLGWADFAVAAIVVLTIACVALGACA